MTDAEAIQHWEERAREAERKVKQHRDSDMRFAVCGASAVACVLVAIFYILWTATTYANGRDDGQRDGELECLREQLKHRSAQ